MASKLLLLYATDTYKLSSLLLRRIIRAKPTTLTAFGENTRQLLLDQSRPPSYSSSANVAAVKILEWDRELNLLQYYGVQDYATRWWASKSWSVSISNSSTSSGGKSNNKPSASGTNQKSGDGPNKKNVARVAFMITSQQRHRLSTELGYTSQDIRSFKPIEALLLLEHDVKRETDDFRAKLKELLEENDRLMNNQHQENHQQQSKQAEPENSASINAGNENDGLKTNKYVSPEEAQQVHATPDVAMALLSVDKDANHEDEIVHATKGEEGVDTSTKSKGIGNAAVIDSTKSIDERIAPAVVDPPSLATTSQLALVNVTPNESVDLHMKPDVAAAILTSHLQKEPRQQQQLVDDQDDNEEVDGDELCWYEVVESVPTKSAPNKIEDGSNQMPTSNPIGEQVIALFPTKKEALECVRIKQSFRSRGRDANNDVEGSQDDRFLVRRRWNP
eukprot:CAMPEP_0172306890 /NCGR_PEP_ID=MMETSP1058-20130122/7864_1 /TAXON_ID=83371 /ORGANISM="Detonula confervacea, Strain CCMP 353" /LENGTH=447 /DNA_ID=CAMNT_0013018919 /DNA_START=186 /DNA_END=1529 /DNA_ORIENTATION=+